MENLTKMEKIRLALIAENAKQFNDTKNSIIEKITNKNIDWWISHYLTELRIKQLKKGELSDDKAIEIATKKATKKFEKVLQSEIEKIEMIASASDFTSLTITVNWKKSNMGNQAIAEMIDNKNRFFGKRTVGYGYDKESTAIASVLNQYKPFLKLMYQKRNNTIEINNRELIGYGSGYGVLPYFEGGVGTSCLYKICESIGLKFENVANGDNFGVFKISVNN